MEGVHLAAWRESCEIWREIEEVAKNGSQTWEIIEFGERVDFHRKMSAF